VIRHQNMTLFMISRDRLCWSSSALKHRSLVCLLPCPPSTTREKTLHAGCSEIFILAPPIMPYAPMSLASNWAHTISRPINCLENTKKQGINASRHLGLIEAGCLHCEGIRWAADNASGSGGRPAAEIISSPSLQPISKDEVNQHSSAQYWTFHCFPTLRSHQCA
jgi:hypothetical protein